MDKITLTNASVYNNQQQIANLTVDAANALQTYLAGTFVTVLVSAIVSAMAPGTLTDETIMKVAEATKKTVTDELLPKVTPRYL